MGGPVDIAEPDRTATFDGGYLWGLSVEPVWRRRGIASALVGRALTRLPEDGASSVSAFVAPDNHFSVALFRSMGFRPIQRRVYVNAFGWQYRST